MRFLFSVLLLFVFSVPALASNETLPQDPCPPGGCPVAAQTACGECRGFMEPGPVRRGAKVLGRAIRAPFRFLFRRGHRGCCN